LRDGMELGWNIIFHFIKFHFKKLNIYTPTLLNKNSIKPALLIGNSDHIWINLNKASNKIGDNKTVKKLKYKKEIPPTITLKIINLQASLSETYLFM